MFGVYIASAGGGGSGGSSSSILASNNVWTGTNTFQQAVDISWGGITLQAGADNNAATRTNSTTKIMRLVVPHYTNAEEPLGAIIGTSTSSSNDVTFGGGSAAVNAATSLSFRTGATITTTDGTDRLTIDNVGLATFSGFMQENASHKVMNAPVTNVTTTFANLTDLTVSGLVAAGKYTGVIVLPVNEGLAADGFKFDLNGGTATMTFVEYGYTSVIGATLGTRTSTALATAITLTALADTNDVFIEISVTLVVNGAGTLIPRQAKNGDAAGATMTVRQGGYVWLKKVA